MMMMHGVVVGCKKKGRNTPAMKHGRLCGKCKQQTHCRLTNITQGLEEHHYETERNPQRENSGKERNNGRMGDQTVA